MRLRFALPIAVCLLAPVLVKRLHPRRAEVAGAKEESHERDNKEGGTGTRAKGDEGAMGATGAMGAVWGREDVTEFGMIGTVGFGSGSGSGHGRLGGAHSVAAAQQGPTGVVRAGEWDDNASYREFQRLLASRTDLGLRTLDVSERLFLVVRDVDRKAIPSCDITVIGTRGTITLRTLSTGRAIFFPNAEAIGPSPWTASARCGGNAMTKTFAEQDAVVVLDGKEPRDPLARFTLDVAFALDTTGSMSEEIAAVQSTIRKVASSLDDTNDHDVRVGLVEYKDRGDEIVTRVYPMESDIAAFRGRVSALVASGGGDVPEAMQSGLGDAVNKLEWRSGATARLLYVIADAPPHLDDQNEPDYRESAKRAAHLGIQIHAVSASGMDDRGQMIFRQIAQYTGGTELFVLRNGAGPQSMGGGDPLSSCGGTQTKYASGNLDALVLRTSAPRSRPWTATRCRFAGSMPIGSRSRVSELA